MTFEVLPDYRLGCRKFSGPLSIEEVGALSQRDFVDYLRENLWERVAQEKYRKGFDVLSYVEKMDVDLLVMLRIVKAMEECKDDSSNS